MTGIEISCKNFNSEVMKALENKEDVLVRHGLHSTILLVGKCDNDNEFMSLRISAAFDIIKGWNKMPCKFKPICNHYDDKSVTCTENGGSYCGTYRKITELINKNRKTY